MNKFVCVAAALLAMPVLASGDGCQLTTTTLDQMDERYVELVNDAGESIMLRARIADEGHELAAGFQHVCPQTIDSTAILFVFEQPRSAKFHMNNVYANLDIAFIDSEGKVADVQLMLEEKSTNKSRLYPSKINAKYALEVRQGFFKDHHISPENSRMILDE